MFPSRVIVLILAASLSQAAFLPKVELASTLQNASSNVFYYDIVVNKTEMSQRAQTADSFVTCKFTADKEVVSVFYGDEDLTQLVDGDMTIWGVQKTLSFAEIAGATLVITARNEEDDGCRTAGFSIVCSSTNSSSSFNGLESDSASWKVHGFRGNLSSTLVYTAFNDSEWKPGCISTSEYSLAGVTKQPAKLWASNGYRYSVFRYTTPGLINHRFAQTFKSAKMSRGMELIENATLVELGTEIQGGQSITVWSGSSCSGSSISVALGTEMNFCNHYYPSGGRLNDNVKSVSGFAGMTISIGLDCDSTTQYLKSYTFTVDGQCVTFDETVISRGPSYLKYVNTPSSNPLNLAFFTAPGCTGQINVVPFSATDMNFCSYRYNDYSGMNDNMKSVLSFSGSVVAIYQDCNAGSNLLQTMTFTSDAQCIDTNSNTDRVGPSWVHFVSYPTPAPSPPGTYVTMYSRTGCTGSAVNVPFGTEVNYCSTTFSDGSGMNDNVRSVMGFNGVTVLVGLDCTSLTTFLQPITFTADYQCVDFSSNTITKGASWFHFVTYPGATTVQPIVLFTQAGCSGGYIAQPQGASMNLCSYSYNDQSRMNDNMRSILAYNGNVIQVSQHCEAGSSSLQTMTFNADGQCIDTTSTTNQIGPSWIDFKATPTPTPGTTFTGLKLYNGLGCTGNSYTTPLGTELNFCSSSYSAGGTLNDNVKSFMGYAGVTILVGLDCTSTTSYMQTLTFSTDNSCVNLLPSSISSGPSYVKFSYYPGMSSTYNVVLFNTAGCTGKFTIQPMGTALNFCNVRYNDNSGLNDNVRSVLAYSGTVIQLGLDCVSGTSAIQTMTFTQNPQCIDVNSYALGAGPSYLTYINSASVPASKTPSPSITSSNSPTSSATKSISISSTVSASMSSSGSASLSTSTTPSRTATSSISLSSSGSISISRTPTPTQTATSSISVSATTSKSLTQTASPSSSASTTASLSSTSSKSLSASSSASVTATPSKSVSPSSSVTNTPSSSISQSSTASVSITASATASITQSPTSSISRSATPSITATISLSSSSTHSITASSTSSVSVSATASKSLTPTVTVSPSLSSSSSPSSSHAPFQMLNFATTFYSGRSCSGSTVSFPVGTEFQLCGHSYTDNTAMNDNLRSMKSYAGTTISILQHCGYAPLEPLQTVTFTEDGQCITLSDNVATQASWVQYQAVPAMNNMFYSKAGCVGSSISHPLGTDMNLCNYVYSSDNAGMNDNLRSIKSFKGVILQVLVDCNPSSTVLQVVTFTADGCIDLGAGANGASYIQYLQLPPLSSTSTVSITPSASSSLTATSSVTKTPSSSVSLSSTASTSKSATGSISVTASSSSTVTPTSSVSYSSTTSPSYTSTASQSRSPSPTSSVTGSLTGSLTPSTSSSMSSTSSTSRSASATSSLTATTSISVSATSSTSLTATSSTSLSPTSSISKSSSATVSISSTATVSLSATSSVTVTPSSSKSVTSSASASVTSTTSKSLSATATASITSTASVTLTSSPTASLTASTTQSLSPSTTSSVSSTGSSSLTPSHTPSSSLTASSSTSSSSSVTASRSASVSLTATSSISLSKTGSISLSPSATNSHAPFAPVTFSATYYSSTGCTGSSVSQPLGTELNLCNFQYSDNTRMNDRLGSIKAYAGTTLTILLNCGYGPYTALQTLTFTSDGQCIDLTADTIRQGPSWVLYVTIPFLNSMYYNKAGCTGLSVSHPVGNDLNLCYYVYSDNATGMNDNLGSIRSYAGVKLQILENCGEGPLTAMETLTFTADGQCIDLSASTRYTASWIQYLQVPAFSSTSSPSTTPTRSLTSSPSTSSSFSSTTSKSFTATASPSLTATATSSLTGSTTPSLSSSATVSRSSTQTVSLSATSSVSVSPTSSISYTPTSSVSRSSTASISQSSSTTVSVTPTASVSLSSSPSRSFTPTSSTSVTATPSSTVTPTSSISRSPSSSSSLSSTTSPSMTASSSTSMSPSPSSSKTASVSATVTPTSSTSVTASTSTSISASTTASLSSTKTVSLSSTSSVTASLTSSTSLTPSVSYTASPTKSHAPYNAVPYLATFFSNTGCTGSSMSNNLGVDMNLCDNLYSDKTSMDDRLRSVRAYAGTTMIILLNCGVSPYNPIQTLTFTQDGQCIDLSSSNINHASWVQYIQVPTLNAMMFSKAGCTGASISHPLGTDMNLCNFVYTTDGNWMNDNLGSIRAYAGTTVVIYLDCTNLNTVIQTMTFTADNQCIDVSASALKSGPSWIQFAAIPPFSTTSTASFSSTISVTPRATSSVSSSLSSTNSVTQSSTSSTTRTPTSTASITPSATVTPSMKSIVNCKMTIDNEIRKVYYNNVDITSTVVGSLNDWTIQKTVTFVEVSGASLAISGYNLEDSGCSTGGFSIVCNSTLASSAYYTLSSTQSAWKSFGSTFEADTGSLMSGVSTTTWDVPCVSTSGYYLAGVSPSPPKLWAANGLKYAVFRYDPPVSTVTCQLTVDNEIRLVYYNNIDITSTVTGTLGDWTTTKTVTFNEILGASFAVSGFNWEDNGCSTGGFSITCTSTKATSNYNGLTSNLTNWKAIGYSTDVIPSTLMGGTSTSSWNAPCQSSSGYYLSNVNPAPTKIWASNGLKYAAFRYDPVFSTVTCKLTIDNEIHLVYYNNQDITSQVQGNLKDWTSPKTVTFNEVVGATFAISGYNWEANGCQTGGFSITCSSTNSNSAYNGLQSDASKWRVVSSNSAAVAATVSGKSSTFSTWNTPCVSTSGYSLSGVTTQPTKLWAQDGLKYVAFRYN